MTLAILRHNSVTIMPTIIRLLPSLWIVSLSGCAVKSDLPLYQAQEASIPDIKLVAGKPAVTPRTNTQPASSGPGLVVYDPVQVGKQSEEMSLYVKACGSYLNFHASGQPEFGKSPLFMRDEPISCKAVQNYQITEQQAPQMTALLGITHIAIGSLAVNGDKVTLTYRVMSEPENKQVGDKVVSIGTLDQVNDSLPRVAKEIAERLGAQHPNVPATMALTPAELRLCAMPYSQELRKERIAINDKDSYAAMSTYFWNSYETQTDKRRALLHALQSDPNNMLLLGFVAKMEPAFLSQYEAEFKNLLRKYQNNSILAFAEKCKLTHDGDFANAVKSARRMVALNPGCAFLHNQLSEAIADQAQDVRQEKFSSKITPSEELQLDQLYPEGKAEALASIKLNPYSASLWPTFVQAAVFAGDIQLGLKAADRIVQFSGSHALTAWVELEFRAPKWGGSSQLQKSQALKIVADKSIRGRTALWVSKQLDNYKMSDLASSLRTKELAVAQELVKKPKHDPWDYDYLATVYEYIGNFPEACRAEATACKEDPNNGWLLYNYARYLRFNGDREKSIAALKRLLAYDPDHEYALGLLAELQESIDQTEDVVPMCTRALKFNSAEYNAPFALCNHYGKLGKWELAAEQVLRKDLWHNEAAWKRVQANADWSLSRRVAVARVSVHVAPELEHCWISYSDSFNVSRDYAGQIKSALEGLKRFPKSPGLNDNLAEGYLFSGDRANAKKYYELTLQYSQEAGDQFWESAARKALEQLGGNTDKS